MPSLSFPQLLYSNPIFPPYTHILTHTSDLSNKYHNQNPKVYFFALQCLAPLSVAVEPVISGVTDIVSNDECVPPKPGCGPGDAQRVLQKFQSLGPAITKATDDLCDGKERACLGQALDLISDCINDDAKSALPDGVNVDEILDASLLICERDDAGTSCGVEVFEFFSAEDSVGGLQACASSLVATTPATCTPACKTLLESVQSQLGCCWATLLAEANKVQVGGKPLPESLAQISQAWNICNLQEPNQVCHQYAEEQKADSAGGASSRSDDKDGGKDGDDGFGPDGKHSEPENSGGGAGDVDIGVIVLATLGGVFGLILIVSILVTFRKGRRRTAAGVAVEYSPVEDNTEGLGLHQEEDVEMLNDGFSSEA